MVFSDFTKEDYSSQDFLRLIEQRVRKEIRTHDLIDIRKTYQLEETKSLSSQVLLYFLKHIFHERLVLGEGELISSEYLELYISKRLDIFLNKGDVEVLFSSPISPLRSITQHELVEVARLLSLQGEFTPLSSEIIDALQEKYVQTKPSFLKSFMHIEQLK